MENNYNPNNLKNLYPYNDFNVYQKAKCGVGVKQPTFSGNRYMSLEHDDFGRIPCWAPRGDRGLYSQKEVQSKELTANTYQFLSGYTKPAYKPLCVKNINDHGRMVPQIQRYNVNYVGVPNSCYKSSYPLIDDYAKATK